jgi:hypothetical protein
MEPWQEALVEIKVHLAELKTLQVSIEKNLDYHIKRTDIVEDKLEFLKRNVYMAQGALAVLGLIATVVGIWAKIS